MISPRAALSIRRIPLRLLEIHEVRARSPAWVGHYVALLAAHPAHDPGLLAVEPLPHGRYVVVDGQTRCIAMLIAGRADALCVVIEEPEGEEP